MSRLLGAGTSSASTAHRRPCRIFTRGEHGRIPSGPRSAGRMPGRLSGPPRPALKGTHPLAIYHRAEDGFLQTLAVKSLLTNSGETGHRGPRDRIPFEVFGPI